MKIVGHQVMFVDSSAFDAEISIQKARSLDERKDMLERLWELDTPRIPRIKSVP